MFVIDLIRHGKTKGNTEHRYVGITDEPLCRDGRIELSLVQKKIREKNPGLIFVSPMRRCVESAKILFPGKELVLIPEFRETDFGSFEYHTYEELKDIPEYRSWISEGGNGRCPGGESSEQVKARILEGWNMLCGRIKQSGISYAAAVIHGGTIMCLLEAFGEPERSYYDWQTENGTGYTCRWIQKSGRLEVLRSWPDGRAKEARKIRESVKPGRENTKTGKSEKKGTIGQ